MQASLAAQSWQRQPFSELAMQQGSRWGSAVTGDTEGGRLLQGTDRTILKNNESLDNNFRKLGQQLLKTTKI